MAEKDRSPAAFDMGIVKKILIIVSTFGKVQDLSRSLTYIYMYIYIHILYSNVFDSCQHSVSTAIAPHLSAVLLV